MVTFIIQPPHNTGRTRTDLLYFRNSTL